MIITRSPLRISLGGGGTDEVLAIVADAAHAILLRDSKTFSGHFFIDEEVVRASGVKNLDHYAVNPGEALYNDLFVWQP